MMKLGADVGNGYTKFNNKKFASRVRLGKLANFGNKKDDVYQIKYEGIDYVVGEGELFTTDDRYYTDDYKICLLTAIALSTDEEIIDRAEICVGLPVVKFMDAEFKEKFEKYLNNLGLQKIVVNGIERIINIRKAIVFVEGAYVVESKDEGNVITFDIGAGTVNIIQWKGQVPVLFDTKNRSFYNLYAKIAKHLRDTGRGSVSLEYVEQNLGIDEIIINQKKVDIRDTKKIIEKHIRELASEVNNLFDVENAEKLLFGGGGALPTFKHWKSIYPNGGTELVKDGQFINAKIYQQVLEMSN
ncbi:UNVERIFIED_ORG: ATPase [Clostridium botulinum]